MAKFFLGERAMMENLAIAQDCHVKNLDSLMLSRLNVFETLLVVVAIGK